MNERAIACVKERRNERTKKQRKKPFYFCNLGVSQGVRCMTCNNMTVLWDGLQRRYETYGCNHEGTVETCAANEV